MARPLFVLTVFLSAFLLFQVQPLVGRLLMPALGGSASVWTACLVFFQAALLFGYGFAHLTSQLPFRIGTIVHVALMIAGLFWLPLAVGGLLDAPREADPTLWLLGALVLAVGVPFVALAANAPTLQRLFGGTDDIARRNPYFLYSASNVGSLLGLCTYPLVLEPLFALTTQRVAWSAGYVVLTILVIACGLTARAAPVLVADRDTDAEAEHISAARALRWVGLAFVPSSLTVGVTAYVSTELAPIPLLWVLPLGLYLLTFIQAFAGKVADVADRRIRLAALAAFPLAVWHVTQSAPIWVLVLLHLGAFYVIALLLHSRLYLDRPPARRLTAFYLWMALGGVLGGAFNGLVAPYLFSTAAEYPLMLIVAAFWLQVHQPTVVRIADITLPRLVAVVSVLWVFITNSPNPSVALWVPAGQIARQTFASHRIRAVVAAVVALLFVRVTIDSIASDTSVERSFFAVHRVVDGYRPGYRALIHGTTVHGMQKTPPDGTLSPVTYFTREGPIGQVFNAFHERLSNAAIGVVGLGAGELASYARPGQRWTFFEIDPVVERIARTKFDYLSRAAAPINVTLGDGRLSIAHSQETYGLLILDAFSSDAIPRHLITAQALETYVDKLAPTGLTAFHISNRFVDLERTLGRLAASRGLAGLIQFDSPSDPSDPLARMASIWVVLAESEGALGPLSGDPRWSRLGTDGGQAWTDEKADILTAIRWRRIASLRAE